MPDRNDAALEFLLTRRSTPAKAMTGPAPDRETLMTILEAAARTPDHGKLEPWRFVVLERPALQRLMGQITECGQRIGKSEEDIAKAHGNYSNAELAVVVVECPVDADKVPAIEQTYSAGAVCLALLNAALASGWGANWLSGWFSHDPVFRQQALGLAPHERVAGIIHIGTPKATPPDRPRPDVAAKTTWVAQ